jgi:galactonate dehydratase
VLRAGAASIPQPALGRAGGLWETRKIAAIAGVYGAQLAPHLYAGPVAWAANIHLAATAPNLLMIECIGTGGEFHLPLIGHTLRVEDGFVTPPEGPGLGISFDERLARTHLYAGASCICRCRKHHATMRKAIISKGARPATDCPTGQDKSCKNDIMSFLIGAGIYAGLAIP